MESRLLPVRMLNEFVYCPRLFHLEWVQSEWADNVYTADGNRVHKRVDRPRARNRVTEEPPKVATSVDLSDEELLMIAKIDLLETEAGEVAPVDFKRGKYPDTEHQAWEPERIQVAAQVLLLRAHGYSAPRGYLWFSGSRRRIVVEVDEELETQTLALRDQALEAASKDVAPPPLVDSPKCEGCSLSAICLPDEHALLAEGLVQNRLKQVRSQMNDGFPLHVTQAGSVIRKAGNELIVEPREGEKTRVRVNDISSLQLHGSVKVTTPALHALMRVGIPISYLSHGGWLYGRTRGPSHKNVLLRLAQFRHATTQERSLKLAQRFIRAKIRNSRTFLRRNGEQMDEALDELRSSLASVGRCKSLESLLGVEGHAAHTYFRAYAIVLQKGGRTEFQFERRNRRPPKDPVNAMLSFAYAMLTTIWTETIDRVGFDAYLGFYHQPKYGRPALALDLMEEFRPLIADSVVFSVVRRGILSPEDFLTTKTACALSDSGRKKFIGAFERRLEDQVTHPVFGYRISYRQVFEVQTRLLSRYLTGEIPEFPEFVTR